MTATTKQYYAFISYKRDDQKWAEWLQEKLEHYKLPTNLNGRSDLPKEIRPVFRDKSELAAGVLADEIQKALDNSKFLIVICSPHSAKSEWVNKEVQSFIDSGRTEKIIPFIIEGTPNSGNDETECFPKAIRELPEEDELLGVNINEMGRDAAAVKVVAQMFGLRFDDLWQRHEREKKRRRRWFTVGIVTFTLMVLGVAGWIWHQNVVLKQQRWQMLESQSKLIAEKAISNVSENSYLTRNLALDLLPKDLSNPDRPYTSESELMLREAMKHNTSKLVKGDTLDKIQILDFHPKGKQFLFVGEYETDSIIQEDKYNNYSYGRRYLFACDVETFSFRVVSEVDHNYWMNCSYSPDGKNILSYSSIDGALRVFDSETLESLKVYDISKNYKSAAYFDDGKNIICRNDTIAGIYNAETGKELRTIKYEKDVVFYFYTSNLKGVYCDNIITMKSDTIINVINATDGELLYSFVTDECYCYETWFDTSPQISPDGRYLACHLNRVVKRFGIVSKCEQELDSTKGWRQNQWKKSQPDGTVVIYDLMKGKEHGRITTYGTCVFSQDGRKILTKDKKTINVWDVETCEKTQVIETDDDINNYMYSPNGNFIVYNIFCGWDEYNNKDTYIKICDSKTGKELKAIKYLHNYDHFRIAPDEKSILYSNGGEIGMCGLDYCDDERILTKFTSGKIVLSSDKKLIALNDEDTTISIIDIETGEEVQSIQEKQKVYPLVFCPDGKSLIYKVWGDTYYNCRLMKWCFDSCDDATIMEFSFYDVPDSLYDYYKERYVFNKDSIKMFLAGTSNELIYNNAGNRFVTTSYYKNKVGVWDSETMTELKTLNEHTPPLSAVFNPKCNDYLLYCNNRVLVVLNTDNDKRLYLRGTVPRGGIYSPDGRIIIASVFGGLEIFSAEDGRLLQKVEGHADKVNHVGYSLDGKHLVTASDDKTIRVWNTETWKCVHVIDNFTDAVVFADFTPDGKHIISASQDSTIRLWDFPPLQELIDQTRERFKNRPLTEEERKMYYLE